MLVVGVAIGRLRRPRATSDEIVDVLAYLARKRANAAVMAGKSPEFADEARWTMRQIDVIMGDLRAGFHHGAAFVAEQMAEAGE